MQASKIDWKLLERSRVVAHTVWQFLYPTPHPKKNTILLLKAFFLPSTKQDSTNLSLTPSFTASDHHLNQQRIKASQKTQALRWNQAGLVKLVCNFLVRGQISMDDPKQSCHRLSGWPAFTLWIRASSGEAEPFGNKREEKRQRHTVKTETDSAATLWTSRDLIWFIILDDFLRFIGYTQVWHGGHRKELEVV